MLSRDNTDLQINVCCYFPLQPVPEDLRNSDISGYVMEYWPVIGSQNSDVTSRFISNALINTHTLRFTKKIKLSISIIFF